MRLIIAAVVRARPLLDHRYVLSPWSHMPSRSKIAVAMVVIATIAAGRADAQATRQPPTNLDRQRAERDADSAYASKDYRRAATLYGDLVRVDSTKPRYWMQLGISSALIADYKLGARAFVRANTLNAGPLAAYNAAAMFARLNQPDSAFAWLDRAVQNGFGSLATLDSDDDLASIRSDARFAKLRQTASIAPMPCRNNAEYHRFDFWIGNWKVTTPAGQPVGTSHVDVVSGGCALLENWRDMRGSEGKSLNTYDPSSHAWRQFWVGQGGLVTDYNRSEWRGPALSFMTRTAGTNGAPDVLSRLTFAPLDSGIVRQFGELSTDDGKTWNLSFDLHYHPVK
ncbi:MAG TPA: hypothetical protein VGM82_01855 [Gemmatimonadaceae bacterium]|jgi:hypothetical protein